MTAKFIQYFEKPYGREGSYASKDSTTTTTSLSFFFSCSRFQSIPKGNKSITLHIFGRAKNFEDSF